MEPQGGFIKANGINHHYLEWGSSDRQPLLMLHATGLCAQPWTPIAQQLASDYHVMAFDQRGHGDSDSPEGSHSFHLLGEDLVAIIEVLELHDLSIVGHSAGGFAAIIADSLLPGRIHKTVLVETRISAPPPDLQQRAERTRMKRAVWDSRDAMYQAYRDRAAFKDWTEDSFRAFIEGGTRLLDDGRAELNCQPETEAALYESRDSLNVEDYLERGLAGSYLLLLGDYPGCQKLEDEGVRRFQQLAHHCQVKPMGTGSHFLPMEYPELVLQEIRGFLLP